MALTDTFVKQVKHKGAEIGERYADGGGMYLRVKAAGKYWRLDYRVDGKPKVLALGVYPAVALRFMAVMSQRLRALEHKLADVAFKSVPQRLATVLLNQMPYGPVVWMVLRATRQLRSAGCRRMPKVAR